MRIKRFQFVLPVSALLVLIQISCLSAQNGNVGGKARLRSWLQHQSMAEQSSFKDLKWERMGPKFAGGRIESIECPAGDLKTIYVAPGAGGIWKSVDGGLKWKPIFEDHATYAVGDLAISAKQPNIIWAGTGECHLSRSSYAGVGVFKSEDAGKSWKNMGLEESAHIGQIVIDPEDSDIVYVACMGRQGRGGQRGIYKTTNGGKTFDRVLHEGDSVAFVDLVIDPFDRQRIFASAWDRSNGNKSGVFRSDDAGKTWKRLRGGLQEEQVGRVAIAMSHSKQGVIYSLMTDRSSPELAKRRNASILFRSNDHGKTWSRTHQGYVPTYVGWDFCDIRVAPDNENKIYVGGLRLISSDDGGKSFKGEGGFAINKNPEQVFRLHPHRGVGLHLDVHDIWIDPLHPNRVLLGNDGGLFSSVDEGETWLHLNSLPITEFYRIHLDNEVPFQIWGGTQDNASFVGPATARYEAGRDDRWRQVFLDPWTGGDGFATFPDPNDSEIVYYTQQNGALQRSRRGRLRPEKRIRPQAKSGEGAYHFAWDTPFFASVHSEPTVLYCAAQRILRSDDRGDSWKAISPAFGDRGLLVLRESPKDSKRLACGDGVGKIQLTRDGGESWQAAGKGLPRKTLRDIEMSHHHADVLFAALSGKNDSDCSAYLFRSADFGKTWTSIRGNLPAESVNAIEEDPLVKGILYAGTDLGVYVSLDEGKTWHSLCATLPTAPVVDLEVHPRDGKLVAATHGLSIFILDISSIRKAASK